MNNAENVDAIIAKARKELKEYNSQKGIYKLDDSFIYSFVREEKDKLIDTQTEKLSRRGLFNSNFKHPFWNSAFGAILGILVIFPFLIFSAIFHKLGISHDNANLLALACSMLSGILFTSTLIEEDTSELRKIAFKAGMDFEATNHIVENYEKALKKLNAK